MNPWIGLDTLLKFVTGGAAIGSQQKAGDEILRATQPAGQPGTALYGSVFGDGNTGIDVLEGPYGFAVKDAIERLGEYRPIAGSIAAQLAENQRVRGEQKKWADEILSDATGSRLGTLGTEVGKYRTDTLEKLDTQTADQSQALRLRAGETETRRNALTGRAETLANETGTYFRGVRDNPNVLSSQELSAMATKFAEGLQGQEQNQLARIQSDATARGLSPAAVASLGRQAAAETTGAAAAYRRDAELTNAVNRAARADQAATSLATLGNTLLGTQAAIDTSMTGVAEGQYGAANTLEQNALSLGAQIADTLFGREAGITSAYEGGIRSAKELEGALVQPENLLLAGGLLEDINRYNTEARAGVFSDNADFLTGLMGLLQGDIESVRSRQTAWDTSYNGESAASAAIGSGAGAATSALTSGTKPWVLSDRKMKTDFKKIDPDELLKKVQKLKISQWRYKQPKTAPAPTPKPYKEPKHVGPMAQDFKKAFGLGDSDEYINTVDLIGVLYPAVQALTKKVEKLEARAA